MNAEPSARPSLSKVALSAVLGIFVGAGLAFPDVSRNLLLLGDAVGGLPPIALIVLVGSLAVLPLMAGLFILWRASRGGHR